MTHNTSLYQQLVAAITDINRIRPETVVSFLSQFPILLSVIYLKDLGMYFQKYLNMTEL